MAYFFARFSAVRPMFRYVSGWLSVSHGFGATGDSNFCATGNDPFGGESNGLQARGTEAVDGHRGDGDRQAGAKRCDAGHVHALLGFGSGTADDDVFDFGGIEAFGAANGLLDGG